MIGLCLFTLTAGCAGNPQAAADPAPPASSPYESACAGAAAKRRAEVELKRYVPPRLLLHRWPGKTPTETAPRDVSEADFVEVLRAGTDRALLLIARGGTGKSKLGWSLEAQLCGALPTARLDLNWDVFANAKTLPGNPVATLVARKFGAPDGADPTAWLKKHTGNKPWLLLLDSLDEVPLAARASVVGAVNELTSAFAHVRAVVMTRPPVYTGNYGLQNLTSSVELPQLTCEATDRAIAELLHDADDRRALLDFAAQFGLDRKTKAADGRCYYPHLSTYRDLFVMRQIAATRSQKQHSALQAGELKSSRASVYAFYLTVLLVKDLQGVSVLPKAALEAVDAMIAARNPAAGDRNLGFSVKDCTAVMPGKDAPEKESRCERLLQSSLFRTQSQADGGRRLRNQSLYDLFLARWADARIAASVASPCKPIREGAALLESNEVAGFLVGLPGGQRCLVAIADELCRRGGFAQHNFEQLDQGLPTGTQRKAIIDRAQDVAGEDAPQGICVGALLDRLYDGGGKPTPAAAK